MENSKLPSIVPEDAPVARKAYRWLPVLALVGILVAHAFYMHAFYAPALGTPDDNGYWAQGSLMAKEGRTWFRADNDIQYIGMHWLVTEDGRYVSRYPPGLPVIIAAFYRLFGWEASVLVNPLLATLTLAGLYLLGRRLVGPWWALAVCGTMAVNPLFNQFAIWCFSHMAVICFLVWGIFLLMVWTEKRRWYLALMAGLVLGSIPTIRYPEAVFGLAFVVYLLWDARVSREGLRQLPLVVAGAALPIVLLLIRNYQVLGSFFRTAYALTGEQTGFGWSYFTNHFLTEFRGLNGNGVGPAFLLGVLGMAAMIVSRSWRRMGVLFLLLTVPVTLLYMAYYWGGMGGGGPGGGQGGADLRFFLPTFPCYLLAGVWLLARFLKEQPMVLRAAAGTGFVLVQAVWGAFTPVQELQRLHQTKELLANVTRKLDVTVPSSAILLGNRELLDHLDFVRHWKLADLSVVQGGRMGPGPMRSRGGDDNRPSPMQKAKTRQLADKYANLRAPERAALLAGQLSSWAGTNAVYFVGTDNELNRLRGVISSADFKVVARIPIPKPTNQQTTTPFPGAQPPVPTPPGAPPANNPAPPDQGPPAPGDPVPPLPGVPPVDNPVPPDQGLPAPGNPVPPSPGVPPADNRTLPDQGPPPLGVPPGFTPPGQMGRQWGRRGGMMGGGFMGANSLMNGKEIVIAVWNGHMIQPARWP
jgi:hypothetical protein